LAEADIKSSDLLSVYQGVQVRFDDSVPEDSIDHEATRRTLNMFAGMQNDQFSFENVGKTGRGGNARLLAKPGPQTVVHLFRPTLEFLARARRVARSIEIADILTFLLDYYNTFFLPTCTADHIKELGGPDGLKNMIRELIGVEKQVDEGTITVFEPDE
jgi:hypothetical protein